MRSLAERAAAAPPPMSAEGTMFYDDFSTSAAVPVRAIYYAIRDTADCASPMFRLPFGAAMPSAVISNGLNQSVTVRWQISGDGVAWIDGAAQAVAAANQVLMAPNNIAGNWVRLVAQASTAPTAGTLGVRVHVPAPRWDSAGELEAMVSAQDYSQALSGSWVMSLKSRVRGAAVGDIVEVSRWVPINSRNNVLELGALIAINSVDSNPKAVEFGWAQVWGGSHGIAATLRYENPGSTGVVSVWGSDGAWHSIGSLLLLDNLAWADMRVAIDVSAGLYAYLAVNGVLMATDWKPEALVGPLALSPEAMLDLTVRTLSAAATEVLVDRIWVRAIG